MWNSNSSATTEDGALFSKALLHCPEHLVQISLEFSSVQFRMVFDKTIASVQFRIQSWASTLHFRRPEHFTFQLTLALLQLRQMVPTVRVVAVKGTSSYVLHLEHISMYIRQKKNNFGHLSYAQPSRQILHQLNNRPQIIPELESSAALITQSIRKKRFRSMHSQTKLIKSKVQLFVNKTKLSS